MLPCDRTGLHLSGMTAINQNALMVSRLLPLLLTLGLAVPLLGASHLSVLHGTTLRATSAEDEQPSVRVRLLDDRQVATVTLTAETGDLRVHLPDADAPIMRLRPNESATLRIRGPEVMIQRDEQGVYASSIDIRAAPGVSWTLVTSDAARTYTGNLHVEPGQASLQIVNAVPIEDYVASVVASEYGFDDLEGSKAMAVVARTYGMRAADKFDGDYDHVDHTASQVYRGASTVTGVARRATAATHGEVLAYDGELIEAVYYSSSGGHTANNEDVWDADDVRPYLRARKDPYDRASPHHRWTARVDRAQLLTALSRSFGTGVTGFVLGDRSAEGRLLDVELITASGRKSVQANAFRIAVIQGVSNAGLKSTWFDASRQGDTYVFSGRGFGHGVGMSQWGAHEMASRGHSYQEILSFYYDGARIRSVESGTFSLPAAPVATSAPAEADLPKDENEEKTTRRIGW